jgi:hypothetical protein
MPEAWRHFIYLALIQWFTSSSMSPSTLDIHIHYNDTQAHRGHIPLGLVWLPSFGARIKEFIYDSNNYLFGCHGIGYGIHLEFHGFSSHA